ncbi:hypothetical protein SLEP1_g59232 [Rubroshorea leprosula]|uniref:Uncharacterized protein n=1 Tax=Rubroshorea leprosula TaxID=152421 RepID=A0AAV5MST9_9ROSI|nr:hypothetical protein SLEP1_g59232 [Rubroshorea leprosula]
MSQAQGLSWEIWPAAGATSQFVSSGHFPNLNLRIPP